MSIKILSFHDGHNSSACYMEDGRIVYCAQEERFSYVKNDGGVPIRTIQHIMQHYGDDFDEIVAVSEYMGAHPWSREYVLGTLTQADSFWNIFRHYLKKCSPVYSAYKKKENMARMSAIRKVFGAFPVKFVDHHYAHALSAYFGRGDMERRILVVTCDGDGDGRAGSAHIGEGGRLTEEVSIPTWNSLGAIYSYMTYLYSLVPMEHEYKIMGLAPYCNDKKRIEECKAALRELLWFPNDTAIRWEYRGRYPSVQTAGRELRRIFSRFRFDVMAAGLQEFTEDVLCEWVRRLVAHTGIHDLALAGGVFMNVKANMRIAQVEGVRSVYVLPSCGDESSVIGAAALAYFERSGKLPDPVGSYYLGEELLVRPVDLDLLAGHDVEVQQYEDIEPVSAKLLAEGHVIGRVKGRMEFGARSLGNRAILANPSVDGVRKIINDMIKGRDFWMPFAPSVMEDEFDRYFVRDDRVMNYNHMIFTADSRHEIRDYAYHALHPYDFTGRPHMVSKVDNPDYYRMLSCYRDLTGHGLILNTSYNLHGYPMVRDVPQAIDVFMKSGLDILAVGNYLLTKKRTSRTA